VADPASRAAARALSCLLLAAAAACAPAAPRVAPVPEAARQPADADAVATLLRLEDRRDFDSVTLARYAASPSPALRARTALALARLRRPEGARALEALLADGDTAVAAFAAFGLGQLGDSAAVGALAAHLRPDEFARRPSVASEAAYALGKIHSPAAADTLLALLSRAPLDSPAEPVGSALLATARLARLSTLDPVLRWLAAADTAVRWRAAYALVRRPDSRATRALASLSTDPDPRVHALALRGLTAPLADSAGIGAAGTLPLLLAALRDSAYSVRINAARALGTYPTADAVAALAQATASPDRHLAVAALEALGQLGSRAGGAVGAVRGLAVDPSAQLFVRQTAMESLAAIRPALAAEVARGVASNASWRLRASAARIFAVAGGPRDPSLATLVADRDGRVAAAALQAALDAAGDSVGFVRPLLLQQLAAPDVFARAVALGGLAKLADPATLPALLDAYDLAQRDTLDDAALAAIDALAALRGTGQEPGRAFFLRFRRPQDPLVRLRAAQAFGAAADSTWGSPLPIETHRSLADYRALIDRVRGRAGAPEVEIVTDAGTLRLRLFERDAPLTVESFLRLAARNYFDGQEWPRVVPNFVIQGGDPRGDTNGGPGYAIRDEINRHRYGTGTLGMALSGPDTGGSQFFVTLAPQPHLDGTYAIFGEVVSGQDVAERVLPGDRIIRVTPLP
jgi:cyclophilin family peptidyl-prolyl cis-trans isomerase/HEAT repeat protein